MSRQQLQSIWPRAGAPALGFWVALTAAACVSLAPNLDALARWTPDQPATGPGWELIGTRKGQQDALIGITAGPASADGIVVEITVRPGGVGCFIPVFAGLVPSAEGTMQVTIDRRTAPDAPADHCLSTGHPQVFTVRIAPQAAPYELKLHDTVVCDPCGTPEIRIEPFEVH